MDLRVPLISELVKNFGGREIPAKFVSFDTAAMQVVVELLNGASK